MSGKIQINFVNTSYIIINFCGYLFLSYIQVVIGEDDGYKSKMTCSFSEGQLKMADEEYLTKANGKKREEFT